MMNYECEKPKVGYAYVPDQIMGDKIFTPEEGLKRATLFPELYLPICVYEGGIKNG